MTDNTIVKYYTPAEERINVTSHAIGLALSVVALILLVARAAIYGNAWHIISFSIFGLSLIMLYTASTVYHSTKDAKLRSRLRIVDHATIYILIAGTYTPFTLVTLNGTTGWWIFSITWGLALTGII
ncbi:MAG: hemolysin III family protein, partial [Gammaproteobacteria bacterium]